MGDETITQLEKLAKLVRYWSLTMTTRAGSGHPTSSLSAAELMVGLLFGGGFRYDLDDPRHPNNDRLIFSKGHASPLFYSLWAAAGAVTEEELEGYRTFGSPLEGHPTFRFRYADAATGSLGQGLSIGLGMAVNAKYLDGLPYRTYVLLGDSEMAEGSQWEAIQLAAHYQLDNLVGIIDVNRLGQRGETMYGHDVEAYRRRVSSFGWEALVVDGHSLPEVLSAYAQARTVEGRPTMIIARTLKGKGVSFLEDKNGWHGKVLGADELSRALAELAPVDTTVRGSLQRPGKQKPPVRRAGKARVLSYPPDKPVATRDAYGNALVRLSPEFPELVSLDAEVSNSTRAEEFAEVHPKLFFEMYIAEQNMVGTALGLACRGKIPFVSTFAAFLSRAFDQIRMGQYSDANVKFVGSHAGVSIGPDGPSQMGLEDLALFRTIVDGVVLYPADAVATEKLVEEAARHRGIVYLRTARQTTPLLYAPDEDFPIGGSKVLRESDRDAVTIVAAGATLFEALKAHDELKTRGVLVRVVDLYSVKPPDAATLVRAAEETRALVTVEDHYAEGGLGEAVRSALEGVDATVYSLAVRKKPRSGKPEELLDYEEISAGAIVRKVLEIQNPFFRLKSLGQSLWLDYIRRDFTASGELRRLIEEDGLEGVTSNPALFDQAIAGSDDYDGAIRELAAAGGSTPELYEALALEDVRAAADVFRPVYDRTSGKAGYVSLEVNPHLAHDAGATEAEARRLWHALDRPNVFVKVPATREGLTAIRTLIAEGINVNVTLLFGIPRYGEVAEAYLAGLEDRAAKKLPVAGVASVASFFLSRIDVLIDPMLEKIAAAGGPRETLAASLKGQVAIASARVAYSRYREIFGSDRFRRLAARGAAPQRVLWASTGTKNPEYSDVKYVDALIGPETINTVPLETLHAYGDHGNPALRLEGHLNEAKRVLENLASLGIDLDAATAQLEAEGVEKFNKPYDALMRALDEKRRAV